MRVLTLIATLLLLGGCAGMAPAPIGEDQRSLAEVVEVKGMSKDEIYIGIRSWVAETFRSAKSVIEYDNQADGILVGNGVIPYPCKGISCLAKSDWTHPFTMKVEVRDERFRVIYSNINLAFPSSYSNGIAVPARNGPVNSLSDLEGAKAELQKLTQSMVSALSSGRQSSDW